MPDSRDRQRGALAPAETVAKQLKFSLQGTSDATAHQNFQNYLASANLRLVSMADQPALHARILQLRLMTYSHVVLPRMELEWPRDSHSLSRGAIVVPVSGVMDTIGDHTVVSNDGRSSLVLPGDTPVTFRTRSNLTELIYISADAAALRSIEFDDPDQTPKDSRAALSPLVTFVTSLCAMPIRQGAELDALSTAARNVALAMARIIGVGSPHSPTLFERAMSIIKSDHNQPELSVRTIADRLKVSPRTLQHAFEARGRSVSHELRCRRTQTAYELLRSNPLTPSQSIASAAGFGSVSTLRRALAHPGAGDAVASSTPETETISGSGSDQASTTPGVES